MWKHSLARRAPSSNTVPARAAAAPNWGCTSQLTHQQLTAQQAWSPSFLSALALASLPSLPLFVSPWRNAQEGQRAGTAASIGASPGNNFGHTQGREAKEMKQWADCQRYPNAWRSRQAQCGNTKAPKHFSSTGDFHSSVKICKDIWVSLIQPSSRPTCNLADMILKPTFTLIKGEYLTWKTGVETLSSTFLPAVTHLTLHQPSALSRRARLLPHWISATAIDRFPSWLLPKL